MKPTVVYVETNEDWHPSYIIGNKKFLRVRYCGKLPNVIATIKHPTYRTCVWGADDFGMEYDTFHEDKALKVFHSILLNSSPLSQSFLKKLGFTYV